jgi:hypothetical protein
MAATEPVAGSGPSAEGPVDVRVGGDEASPAEDQPDRLGDRLERIGAGLPETTKSGSTSVSV